MDASPIFEITNPFLRFTFLKRAAPVAISAEPPTIALFGRIPKGGKNACMEPPSPRLNPFSRPKISASAPYKRKSRAKPFTSSEPPSFSTTRKQSPPRNSFMMVSKLSSSSLRIADIPLARISPCERCDPRM